MRFAAILLLISVPVHAQHNQRGDAGHFQPQQLKRLPDPASGAAIALADAEAMPKSHRLFVRYLWQQDHGKADTQGTVLALNYVSRASTPIPLARAGSHPFTPLPAVYPLAGGQVLRIDLRRFAPTDQDLADWLKLWEEFQFDPAFSRLITKDTINLLSADDRAKMPTRTREVKQKVTPYRASDGKTYDYRWAKETVQDVDVVRVNAPTVAAPLGRLQLLLGTTAPIVDTRYFQFRALSTIRDDGLYKQLLGGLYYDLRGIRLDKKKGQSDLDALLERLGIGSQAVSAKRLFDRLRSDERLAMFRSNVTGRPRRVYILPQLAVRPSVGQGTLFITGDFFAKNIDVAKQPLFNLLDFLADDAHEVIWVGPNGLHGFSLYNGAGDLVDEVPPDVAADHEIPRPHVRRLQAAIGCIRCHGKGTSYGLQPLDNDVLKLFNARLDVFGDAGKGEKNKSVYDSIDRIAGLYTGNADRVLRAGRDGYMEAVLRCTGAWPGDLTTIVRTASERLSDTYAAYWFATVDAQQALRELGISVAAKDATATFRRLLPPDLRATNQTTGIVPEDVRIAMLRLDGGRINRVDWALVYSFAAERLAAQLRTRGE